MDKAVENRHQLGLRTRRKAFIKNQITWWMMLLPGLLITLIFKYGAMFGVVIAFEDFNYAAGGFFGHEWVGLENFIYVFTLKDFSQSIINTLIMQIWKIVLGIVVPLVLALLINEVGKKFNERTLRRIRQYYRVFCKKKWSPMATKLSWSHYKELLIIKNNDEYNFKE